MDLLHVGRIQIKIIVQYRLYFIH